MDISVLISLGFVGLTTLGVVNFITMLYPNLKSKYKLIISIAVAFGLSFVPAEFGNMLLDHAKVALEAAFAASGIYKIAQKAGGE